MKKIWGVKPRNGGQEEAIQALVNPDIDLVVLEGIAGSGKTLLALAAGLHQVFDLNRYHDIIFTRATVGVGGSIGFLPGTEEEKMHPWCGALIDNLEELQSGQEGGKFGREMTGHFLAEKIKILSMFHIRGRSFNGRYVIVDECQNMSKSEMKVLVSRAGEGTKVVLLGDVDQIDNKQLNLNTNGLTHILDRAATAEFISVVELPCGERSRLATWAGEEL